MKTINSSIGIVALSLPSIGRRKSRVKIGIAALQGLKKNLIIGKTVFSKYGYCSDTRENRANDLMSLMLNPNVSMILNTTGGYNSNDILDLLDYKILQKNPKWFVGYSDITAVNLALYTKTGIPTINGPMIVDIVDDPSVFQRFFKLIRSKKINYKQASTIWEWNKKNIRKCPSLKFLSSKKNEAKGILISGNLSTFVLMIGTPYFPELDGTILFLEYDQCEDQGLPSVQRMLWQLRQTGMFDKINGLVLGMMPCKVRAEETNSRSIKKILEEVTKNYRFPVIYDAAFGHIYPSWPLINGSIVKVNAKDLSICASWKDFPNKNRLSKLKREL